MKHTLKHYKNISAFVLGSVIVLAGCQSSTQPLPKYVKDRACLDETQLKLIALDTPVVRQVVDHIHLTGAVEANPDNVFNFTSLIDGIITKTYFKLGDKVRKGQVLAELNSSELINLSAEAKLIDLQIKVAQKKLENAQSFYNDGLSSENELLEAQIVVEELHNQKASIQSKLKFFTANNENGSFLIKAPADGYIIEKAIVPGTQILASGDPLFTIAGLDEVWVMLNIHASNIQLIQEGIDVNISTLSYPGEIFTGKVAAISQVFDDEAKVLQARVVISNKTLRLKPGMMADVTAFKKRSMQAVSIPTNALIFDNNENYLLVYKNNCDLEIRKVNIISKNDSISFLSEGLEAQEQFVTQNQLLFFEQIKNFQNN